jgi:uncharacterized Tic20 family protein
MAAPPREPSQHPRGGGIGRRDDPTGAARQSAVQLVLLVKGDPSPNLTAMTQPPYPPGAAGPPPPGYANSDEKTWALLAHFGGAVLGFIPPLLAFLIKGPQSPTVRAHAVAALNFQIVCSATLFILSILGFCAGFALPDFVSWLLSLASLVVWIGSIIFAIIGGLRANEGRVYQYPIDLKLVK